MKLLCLLGLVATAFAMGGMDSDEQCCGWAIMDECETNPFWMKVNCQKSCGTAGCTVAGAKADKDGAEGACLSNKDFAFLAGCKWNREFLEANWDRSAQGGNQAIGEEKTESEFIVPDAKPAESQGSYSDMEKPEAPPMDVPMVPVVEEAAPIVEEAAPVVEEAPEEPVVEEVPEPVQEVEPEAPVEEVVEEVVDPVVPETLEIAPPAPEEPEIVVEEVEQISEPVVEMPEEVPEEPMMDAPAEEPAVEDMNESCCGWAAYEECGNNPAWMKVNCAKSCFVKDGVVDNEAAIAAAEENCGEYRQLFLDGVPLGEVKKEEPVEEKVVEEPEEPVVEEPEEPVVEEPVEEPEEPAVEEKEEPVEEPEEVPEEVPEEPQVEEEEAPETPVEEVPEEPEAPEAPVVEEPAEEPEMAMDVMPGGYRRVRASRH